DGPNARPEEIKQAAHMTEQGGLFGYRFQFPAMRVGRHEVYWHRPLAAYWVPHTEQAALVPGAPLGSIMPYDAVRPDRARRDERAGLGKDAGRRCAATAGIELTRFFKDFKKAHLYLLDL